MTEPVPTMIAVTIDANDAARVAWRMFRDPEGTEFDVILA
jgi:hypothetical protein